MLPLFSFWCHSLPHFILYSLTHYCSYNYFLILLFFSFYTRIKWLIHHHITGLEYSKFDCILTLPVCCMFLCVFMSLSSIFILASRIPFSISYKIGLGMKNPFWYRLEKFLSLISEGQLCWKEYSWLAVFLLLFVCFLISACQKVNLTISWPIRFFLRKPVAILWGFLVNYKFFFLLLLRFSLVFDFW